MSDLFLNLVLVFILSAANAEYPCVCNYNVEQSVLPYANAQAQPIGYVYEFDCKPTYPLTNLDRENWYTIIYNGQVAYLQKNSNAEEMECAGQPAPEDRITTKMSPVSFTYSTIPATKSSEKESTNTTRQLNTTQINGLFSYPTNILPQRTIKSHAPSWSYSTTMVTETSVKTSALPDSTNSQTKKMTSSTKYKDGTPSTDSGTDGPFPKYTTTKTNIYSAPTVQAFSNLTTMDPKNLSLVTYSFSTPSLSPSSKATHSSVRQNTTPPSSTTKILPGIITGYISSTNIGAVNSVISKSQTSEAFTTSRSKQTTESIKPGQTSSAQTSRTVTTDYRSLTQASRPSNIALVSSTQIPAEMTTTRSSIKQTTKDIEIGRTSSSQIIDTLPGQNPTEHSSSKQKSTAITFGHSSSKQRTEEVNFSRSSILPTIISSPAVSTISYSSSTQIPRAKMTSRSSFAQKIVTLDGSFSTQVSEAKTSNQSSATKTTFASSMANTSRSSSNHTGKRSTQSTTAWSMTWTSTPTLISSLRTTNYLPSKTSSETKTDPQATTENTLQTTVATTQRPTPPSSIGDISLCGQKLFQYTREDKGALTQYGSKCYELVPFELIWTKAELDCQAKGGHLLTVHSNLFQEFIYKWVKRFSGIPAVWLGLSNKQQDGFYQWISGERLRTKSWYAGSSQSHRNNSEECGLMVFSPPYFGQWETVDCGETTPTGDRGSQNAFICEFHVESLIMSGQIIGK